VQASRLIARSASRSREESLLAMHLSARVPDLRLARLLPTFGQREREWDDRLNAPRVSASRYATSLAIRYA
jgi:hypothetical protein